MAGRAESQRASVSAMRTELLHESDRTRVTRSVFPDGTLIRKELLGPDGEKRRRRELSVLERLSGVDGVVQLADDQPSRGSILLEDVHGEPLAGVDKPLDAASLTALAVDLARVVAAIHERGVIHRDINPSNVVLAEGHPVIIDFTLAATAVQSRPEFAHHTEIVGTLPYLAPEQTSRMGRPVDQRSDLYELGATLYELATGETPFGSEDPVRIIHDQLTRVPAAPVEVNPRVWADLSAVIMRLLDKEPDNRYQTADGLVHDLVRVRDGQPLGRPGEHDFPARVLAPSRLAGRDDEIASLAAAFAAVAAGRCRGVVVGGPPGAGKTSLIDTLQPIVTASGGWFVSGKFDQHRRGQEFDGVYQAMRALGRLLLAEPEDELADIKGRLLRALGQYAGLLTAVVPEFATLLRVPPDFGDPLTAQARAQRSAAEVLRAVASRSRPVVFVIDDLQWAGRTPLGLVDQIFSGAENIEGLLLVGAYRDNEVEATNPLGAMAGRWDRQGDGPTRLHVGNLTVADTTSMVADLLRIDISRVADLAAALFPRTMGNPYDTVELLYTMRHDGLLTPSADGWRWDVAALGERGRADMADLLAERVDAVPPPTRALMDAMACLAFKVELRVLETATALPAPEVERQLTPALDDGLLVWEPGPEDAVRFRHDRVQESILRRLGPGRTGPLRLRLARRLGKRPEFFAVAAELYLQVADAVYDPGERRLVADLLDRAADQAKLLSNYPLVERLLAAAVEFADPADAALLVRLHTGRHLALYSLGRLDEADAVYESIDRLSTSAVERAEATLVQVSSLTNQGRSPEAMAIGVDLLRQLGLAVPPRDRLDGEVEQRLEELYRWMGETTVADDLAHAEITDPALHAVGALMNRLMPPAFFTNQSMMNWLSLQALRMWADYGPDATLVGPASHIAFVITPLRQDYRTAYRLMQRILAVGEARGYEPHTSQARFLFALGSDQWFEAIEEDMTQTLRAREGLVDGGDLQNACWTYYPVVYEMFDCAPSLDSYVAEVESGLEFARRTGNNHAAEMFAAYRGLAAALRGEPVDVPTEAAGWEAAMAANPLAAAIMHVTGALGAALLDRPADLTRHTAAAMPLLRFVGPSYPTAVAHVLLALSLADELRTAAPGDRTTQLSKLDDAMSWLAARAADAPANFLHLLHLLEAQRSWATGDFRTAAGAFDAAQREVVATQRPWHYAMILERTARFYLAHGIDTVGGHLLAQARQAYLTWGATAKVDQIDRAYPAIGGSEAPPASADASAPADVRTGRSTITTGTIDLLSIHAASQALSSETTVDGLRNRVADVLSAMTGATGVHLLLWDDERRGWLLPTSRGDGAALVDDTTANRRLVPLSVVRYVERTRETVVVSDATHDDRFARDPFLTDVDRCSLLAVPILNRGDLRALLLLENRLIRGAFSADRLDGVMLIAGQLAVSLDNAQVHLSLERKVAERTEQLTLANQRLEQLSTTDPLTGVANRRRLGEVLDAEWRRAERTGRPLAIAMIDIDRFKWYNDRYGHAAGDRCLLAVATELSGHVRDGDVVARYGGEEFAVVMPEADLGTATYIAERLRTGIVALAEPALPDQPTVTVSVGVAAAVPSPGGKWAKLVKRADVQLYHAKRAGRNQVQPAAQSNRRE
jgi:diguanylate cyclase (GGDEF)-like protein